MRSTPAVRPHPSEATEQPSHEHGAVAAAPSRSVRGAVLGLGVVACVATSVALVVVKLDDALGHFDRQADTNASLGYEQRAHTYPGWSPAAGGVLEDARLWMPEDAEYRVVFLPGFDPERTPDFSRYFLLNFLLPRRPTSSASAEWVICYGCENGGLGRDFELLSSAEGGPSLGRMRR